jgi:hypothetical protein
MASVKNIRIGNKPLIQACLSQYLMAIDKLGRGSLVQIAIMGDDPTTFVFKIEGITGTDDDPTGMEFGGGQYLGIIWQSDLRNPPKFKIYTPNGVMKDNTESICTSISKYHPQNYRPELKIYGFICNMMGALKCWRDTKHGIGLLYDGDEKLQTANIIRLAAKSKAYNIKHHADILEAFIEESLVSSVSKKLEVVALEEDKIEQNKIKMIEKLKKPARARPTRKPKTPASTEE